VKSGIIKSSSNNEPRKLIIGDLPTAQYFLWIKVGNKRFVKKFIKQ
jgi:hypothetical protein